MKTLIITDLFPPRSGGVSIQAQNIARYLEGDTTVLTPAHHNTESIDSNERFTTFRLAPLRGLANIIYNLMYLVSPICAKTFHFYRASKKIIKSHKTDVVHCIQPQMALIGFLLQLTTKVPYIVYVNGPEFGGDRKLLRKNLLKPWLMLRSFLGNKLRVFLLKRSAGIIANSGYTKDQVVVQGVHPDKIEIINPGLTKMNNSSCRPADLLSELRLQNRKIILTVGSLIPIKNQQAVIRVLPQIRQIIPNISYLVVGDGSEKELLQLLSEQLGVSEMVYFVGKVPHETISTYYQIADVFVLPSKECKTNREFEGFGMTILEANFFGLPVVGAKTGGIQEAIMDGETGLLVDPDDPNDLFEAIIKILTNPEYAKQLGDQGKRYVENGKTWSHAVKRIENHIHVLSENINI